MNYINCATRLILNGALEIIWTLIDLSGSMNLDDWSPSRKAGAVAANKELIRVKAENYPTDRMGIIGFGTNAEVLHTPVLVSTGAQSLCRALDCVESMGKTNITEALELAENELLSTREDFDLCGTIKKVSTSLTDFIYGMQSNEHQTSDSCEKEKVTKRLILLSDGDHNATGRSPVKRATILKSAGIVIDCIGIGGYPSDIDEETLKKIASINPDGSIRYCFIGDKQQLIRKYETLAYHIRPA
ncbi:MAG: vWA domain-containing protein [Sedimentisphaerales bacterium]|jgi:Mg-chelatase subunit ChlD